MTNIPHKPTPPDSFDKEAFLGAAEKVAGQVHKPIGEPDLDDLHEKIRIYAHAPIGHAKAGELGNNYLMDKKSTDILSSSIADYAIAEVRKWLAAQPQPLNDGELDLNDPKNMLQFVDDPIEKFNLFIKKWCPSYSHLIDSDDNDGQEMRDMIAKLAAHSPSTEAAVNRCICPMCEYHVSAHAITDEGDENA